MKRTLPFIVLIFGLGACLIYGPLCYFGAQYLWKDVEPSKCTLPPVEYSAADLVGTWVSVEAPKRSDTLLIREDGTYKQIIHIEHINRADVDYESDWQPWWLEYSKSDIPYLYLRGMRLCAAYPESVSCDQVGGGDVTWYDYCRDKWVYMRNKGVLVVVGTSTHDIRLVLFGQGAENPWTYEMREP